MASVIITDTNLSDIADAIRAKNGTQNVYTPAQMSIAIAGLPGNNYQSKTVTPSLSQQTVVPDGSQVTIGTITFEDTTLPAEDWISKTPSVKGLTVVGTTYHLIGSIEVTMTGLGTQEYIIDRDITWGTNVYDIILDTTNLLMEIDLRFSDPGSASFIFTNNNSVSGVARIGQTITIYENYGETSSYDALSQVIVNAIPGAIKETGIYQPEEDIARPTITFANAHYAMPVFVMMTDTTNTYDNTTNSNYYFAYIDWYKMLGTEFYPSSTAEYFGQRIVGYRGTTTSALTFSATQFSYNSDSRNTSSTYPRYYVMPHRFMPYTGSTTRYWRAGRTYKWIALWLDW